MKILRMSLFIAVLLTSSCTSTDKTKSNVDEASKIKVSKTETGQEFEATCYCKKESETANVITSIGTLLGSVIGSIF